MKQPHINDGTKVLCQSISFKPWANAVSWTMRVIDELFQQGDDDNDSDNDNRVRVLVPLRGKTVDMVYFAKDRQEVVSEVVGCDGVEQAMMEFAQDNPELDAKADEQTPTTTSGGYKVFKGKNSTLLKGDFFELTEQDAGGKFKAVLDPRQSRTGRQSGRTKAHHHKLRI